MEAGGRRAWTDSEIPDDALDRALGPPEAKPMEPGDLGRFVCVAHGGCLHRHRTITEDGVWVRSPDPDPLNPGSYLYSSAHLDCYEQWAANESR